MNSRNTIQKQIILDAVLNCPKHPTATEVLGAVQKTHPGIAKATVYRILRELAGKGRLVQMSGPNDIERYDTNTNTHAHLKCSSCNRIIDLEISLPEDILDKVTLHKVDGYSLMIFGKCNNCL